MNVADYAAGCVALALTLLPWPFAGYRCSTRLLPDWTGSARALVAAVIAVSGVLVVAEVVGSLGGFARWPMAGASAVVAAAILVFVRPAEARENENENGSGAARSAVAGMLLAAVCVLGVSAALLGRDARVVTTGPSDVDSLNYHLSDAAQFTQSHSIDHIYQTGFSDAAVYYPLNDELLDAVAMLGPRPDIATLGLNLGFAWLALLACWVIGARWQVGAATVAAGSSVLAIPLIAGSSTGPGLNDIPTIAALLSAVAIVVHAESRPARWLSAMAVTGLAIGLGAGGKVSALAAVTVLAVVAVAVAPARRLATAGVLVGAAVVTGGFWYVRDWIAVGTPVPEVNLTIAGHGLHGVPYPLVKPYAFSVAHYLSDYSIIRHSFVPQLKTVATPLWPVVLAVPLLGILLALVVRGERLRRLLALVGVVGIAIYLVTPTTALGAAGHPNLFGANVRYVVPVIALGTVLFATAKPLRRISLAVTVGFTALTFALLASSTTSLQIDRPAGWAAAVLLAVGIGWGYAVARHSPSRALTVAVAAAVLVALANAGGYVQHKYLHHRYTRLDARNLLFIQANAFHDRRIGIAGFPLVYPFYGPDLDNHVKYLGVYAPDHSFGPPATCPEWRRLLARGHYDTVIIEPQPLENTNRLLAWTISIPHAGLLLANSAGSTVRLPAQITDAGCPASTS